MTDDANVRPDEIVVHAGKDVFRAPYRTGDSVLETLRKAAIPIQTQCERAYCGSCVFQLLEGEVRMRINEVLSAGDLADGLRLACQGEPWGSRVEIELF